MRPSTIFLSTILSVVTLFYNCSSASQPSTELPTSDSFTIVKPGQEDQKTVQTALMQAKPGDTIYFEQGTYNFTGDLSLEGIDSVTLMGKGNTKTIFSFKDQTDGAQGLIVRANHFTIQDMAIEDTKGDGIKVQNADGVIFRRLRVEWTRGPDSLNGSYGIYPVFSKNILMEECIARGASDAGVYVGQSENAIVRNNQVELNVAGIEIENTIEAEVYGNKVTGNTGGIMIFDLPGLPKKNGSKVIVRDNIVANNNQPNFSPLGISVSIVPAGTGLLFMACQEVEAYNNQIVNNQTIGAAILTLDALKENKDTLFDIYPSAIYLHNNTFKRETVVPDTSRSFGKLLYEQFGMEPPMIIHDGAYNPAYVNEAGKPIDGRAICIKNNEGARVFNVAKQAFAEDDYNCTLESIEPIKLNSIL